MQKVQKKFLICLKKKFIFLIPRVSNIKEGMAGSGVRLQESDIIAPESFRHRVRTALPDVFVDV